MQESQDGFTQNYLLFLQLSGTLPVYYFSLVQFMRPLGINLVPVSVPQLNKFQHWEAQNLLIITPDIATGEAMKRVRRKYLDFALINRRYRLFHLTATSDDSMPGQLRKMGNYFLFRLPCYLNEVAEEIAQVIIGEKEHLQWPGGTRAKIPQL